MGRISLNVNMSQQEVRALEKYVLERTHAPLSKHFEKFIQPWINEIKQPSSLQVKRTRKRYALSDKISYRKDKNLYQYLSKIDGVRKSFSSKDKALVEKFKTEFESGDMSISRFEQLRNKYHPSPSTHLYWSDSRNNYNIVFNQYTFVATRSKVDAERIRDYISWVSDKLKLYKEAKGHKPKAKYFLDRIENDSDYQEYLEERKTRKQEEMVTQ